MKPTSSDFEELIVKNRDMMFRICRTYAGSLEAAEDLYQEATINVWKALTGFKGQSKISTWIYRITVNTAITGHRKNSRNRMMNSYKEDIVLVEDTHDRQEKLDFEKRFSKVLEAIQQLPNDQRILIGLYLENLSYKEIAEVMGKDTNYIGVNLNRVKAKLTKMMNHG